MMVEFLPARSLRSFEDVVRQIEVAIVDGGLKPGERLPPERELTGYFRVSRGTVREALRVLEYAGLITVKKGARGGAFVSRSSTGTVVNSLKWLIRMRRISLRDLAEFRERLEGGAARDAAQRATRKDLERLAEIVAELERVAGRRDLYRRVLELDVQVHRMVVEAAGNALSGAVMSCLTECMQEAFDAIPDRHSRRVASDHQRLLAALGARDGAAAEAILREHIRHFTRIMLAETGAGRAGARRGRRRGAHEQR